MLAQCVSEKLHCIAWSAGRFHWKSLKRECRKISSLVTFSFSKEESFYVPLGKEYSSGCRHSKSRVGMWGSYSLVQNFASFLCFWCHASFLPSLSCLPCIWRLSGSISLNNKFNKPLTFCLVVWWKRRYTTPTHPSLTSFCRGCFPQVISLLGVHWGQLAHISLETPAQQYTGSNIF